MGNPRLPTAIKEQRGTLQPCRTNPDEPKLELSIPDCPEGLSERAARVYPRVARMLYDMRVLTEADAIAVEGLCQAYADWRLAVEFLDEHGTTYIVTKSAPDGSTFEDFKPYPQVAMRNDADKRMRAWLQSCGLTPADRSKVSALDKKPEDPWAGLSEQ